MVADLLTRLVGANLAAALAIVAVLVARRPMRGRFGAQAACRLWWAPLLSLTALLSGHEHPGLGRLIQAGASALIGQAGPGRGEALLAVWLGGAAVTAGVLAVRHAGFLRRARAGGAGPAMVGVLVPRMVAPADFAQRFTTEERAIIRAHERGHVERGDLRVNAVAAVLVCLNWFNPLVHLAARRLREDQELACDAHVTAVLPLSRRRYAETLLKAQLLTQGSPLASAWSPSTPHPLEERVRMLALGPPAVDRRYVGLAVVAALATVVAGTAWSFQPIAAARSFAGFSRRLVILPLILTPADRLR